MPSESDTPEPLSAEARGVLKVLFVTLFLDLVGFSIIFPLFPSMLEYYTAREGNTLLLGSIVDALERFTELSGGPSDIAVIVLFGGVLGSLYSLLQFACAPIIGVLSDRYGRRPVLVVCIAGLALSYVLWFFAGWFVVLVLARVIGGAMSGNISTATAVVADVTSDRNRSKGMAIIGMAFGLGFIIGPALGGVSAIIDLTALWPGSEAFGVNPFSMPALAAFLLAVGNLIFVLVALPETHQVEPAASPRIARTANPLRLFRTQEYPGVTVTNLTNFVFLTAFSGMEFSLTFLGLERLSYGPQRNAMMLLFVGLVLVAMQGFYVRAYSPIVGPRRMAIHGFLFCIPGFMIIAGAESTPILFAGLLLMAVGAAQVIPCLTALVSVYTPADDQGRVLGVFRSLGALARGVGPLVACVLYWRMGAGPAYLIGAAVLIIPLLMAWSLPNPLSGEEGEESPVAG